VAEKEKIWVTIPPQTDPALVGKGMLRKPGPRRSRQYETPDEIMSGIQGQPIPSRPKFRPDYFVDGEPELVELDRWVMRKLVTGSLVRVCGPGRLDRDIVTSAIPEADKLFDPDSVTPDAVEPSKE